MTQPWEDIAKACREPLNLEERKFLAAVYRFAYEAHDGQKRKSGEPYIIHTVATAKTLAEIGMDVRTIAAGLLHDVPEDTERTLADIEKNFGEDIAYLVDGVTKLGKLKLRGSHEEIYLENLRG